MSTAKVKNVFKRVDLGLSLIGLVVSTVLLTCQIIDSMEKNKENKQISNT